MFNGRMLVDDGDICVWLRSSNYQIKHAMAINVATVEVSKCATLSKNYTATSYDYSYSNYIHIRSYNILIL